MHSSFLSCEGDTYADFRVITSSPIQELNCFFKEILHIPTGARIIHIENDDPENLFCLSFQTLPQSSNGAPHILEHTVLCGSKKFPVKDPFFAMMRRSLNTFMNAFTGADFTCYPAASQVKADFYNLLNVYLDAVFHAKIDKNSFLQEGCRLEFETANDPSTPLQFKGIVYNEMKGARASCDSRMWHIVLEELFPNLPYQYDSGGDPKCIPSLSYDELLAFYRTYYHPSRCLFFFCGNLPLQGHLDYIQEHAFNDVTPLPPLPPLPLQQRFATPKRKTAPYPVHADEEAQNKVVVSFGWLTCPLIDQEEVLALSILDSILTDTDASPLKHVLLESGLCTQAGAFIDIEMSEVPYVITCKGCKEGDIDKLEELLFTQLESLSRKPLPKEWIDAAIHQLEFSRMEISGDQAPFGLTLFFRSALAKQHGCDPKVTLQLQHLFDILHDKVQDPLYLPGLIQKHLLDNKHRVRVTMIPDSELGDKESKEELERLKGIQDSLSLIKKAMLIDSALELEKIQDQQEEQDLSCLPKVTLADVPPLVRNYPLHEHKTKDLHVFHHETFTNHIVYAHMLFDLPALLDEDLPYLQLLLSLLPELGAQDRDYKANLEALHSYTGGIGIGTSLHVQARDSSILRPTLSIRGKALERNTHKLFSLMQEIVTAPQLQDKKRIADLLKQIHTSLQSRIQKNASRYATQLSLSSFSQSTHFHHSCFGLRYYHFILDLMKNLDTNLNGIVDALHALYDKVFSFHKPEMVLSCDSSSYEKILRQGFFDFHLPKKNHIPWVSSFPLSPVLSQGKIIPAQVAYNIQAFKVSPYIHPHAAALTVATELLENKVLHNQIREIGGAYGAGATYLSSSGCFYFHSYRDPHIADSFETFDRAIKAIAQRKFSKQDLEEAKLGIAQHMDTPVSPGSRAILAYEWEKDGKTTSLRQTHRDNILNLTSAQLSRALEAELLQNKAQPIEVSFAGRNQFEKEEKKLEKRHQEFPISSL